jgi:serine/threonine protein kinase
MAVADVDSPAALSITNIFASRSSNGQNANWKIVQGKNNTVNVMEHEENTKEECLHRNKFTKDFSVAIKIVPFANDPLEHCVLASVLPEVAILDELSVFENTLLEGNNNGGPAIALLDYGVTASACWMVTELCEISIRPWRATFYPLDAKLTVPYFLTLLDIFACVMIRLLQLHKAGIAHFDIKGDNILLRDGGTNIIQEHLQFFTEASEKANLHPNLWKSLLPIICFADFGSATHSFDEKGGAYGIVSMSDKSRGTECIRAPELLNASKNDALSNEKRKQDSVIEESTGAKCDAWSAVCFLYELIIGNFLFDTEANWATFFLTVTASNNQKMNDMQEAMADSKVEQNDLRLPLLHAKAIICIQNAFQSTSLAKEFTILLEELLVRNPNKRPTIDMILQKVLSLREKIILKNDVYFK